jgi:lipopolysaccharide transport system ATP-binding protein
MGAASITIEGLSKKYRIGAARDDYQTARDRIAGMFRKSREAPEAREFWALRDIDLEIGEGEAVGLIGHNGAGKSTLLKILSRITEPTEGRVVLHGRVASLLEVGTGFHPELTGRENIFLNGAILGMSREEIRRNFDAIVEFAEIGKFLETPVKRYSSGMYVRLAFAVAAHLTPEILLVDEVLAVGDVEFQRRCLGRMNEVARSGRTVVFVSHNLDSIERLCSRAVLLSGGRVAASGAVRDVISGYLAHHASSSGQDLRGFAAREGTGSALITLVEIVDPIDATPLDEIDFMQPFCLRMHIEASERLSGASVGFAILDERDTRVLFSESTDRGLLFNLEAEPARIDCVFRSPHLLPGSYRLEAWVSETPGITFADHVRMFGSLVVRPRTDEPISLSALSAGGRGNVWVDAEWSGGSDRTVVGDGSDTIRTGAG